MIDAFTMLVSTLLTLLVIWRAVRLNRETPWFERVKASRVAKAGQAALSRRAGPLLTRTPRPR